ncbi:hypothetical protein IP87_04720 [beta proteobacterium AAP121]|nr:hypothetical protein IP80_16745 [beta proteobacterium AAP65]KPF99620.1 hypothetical protein IP87_04720 [beta proteobacterium AAP121]
MKCVVCGKPVPHQTVDSDGGGGMHPWCSEPCGARWRTRNQFLFKLSGQATLTGEQILGMIIDKGMLDGDVRTLTKTNQVSKAIRPLSKEHELGAAFQKAAVHQQQRGTKTETYTTTVSEPTGKKIMVEKTSVKGITFKRQVAEMKDVTTTHTRKVPNIVQQAITPDQMFEIALMAYNTAVELRSLALPVILYRVDTKGTLTSEEKKKQTLSSSVHASVGRTEVWPLEKTAAWIQGAMRARVSFVLLNDPRGKDALVGGVDKRSDAVFVRELHQITSMRYEIKKCPVELRPKNMKSTEIFILEPPAQDLGVLPLVPRISPDIWSHTWDSSQSNLTLGDPAALIRNHLRKLFDVAGQRLAMAAY